MGNFTTDKAEFSAYSIINWPRGRQNSDGNSTSNAMQPIMTHTVSQFFDLCVIALVVILRPCEIGRTSVVCEKKLMSH